MEGSKTFVSLNSRLESNNEEEEEECGPRGVVHVYPEGARVARTSHQWTTLQGYLAHKKLQPP